MPDVIQVQVRIERKTKYGDYHDALYFPVDDFFDKKGIRKITDQQIETLARQRVSNHEKNIDDAKLRPPQPEPTADEMFGGLPDDYVAKFEQWVAAKKNPVPADTLPGPSVDSIAPVKPSMKAKT